MADRRPAVHDLEAVPVVTHSAESDDVTQVVLGQVGEHIEPLPCWDCGKSASACGRSREFCCAACSRSRFGTHVKGDS